MQQLAEQLPGIIECLGGLAGSGLLQAAHLVRRHAGLQLQPGDERIRLDAQAFGQHRQIGHEVRHLLLQHRHEQEEDQHDQREEGDDDGSRGDAARKAPGLEPIDRGIEEIGDRHADHERQHDGAQGP